MNIIGDRYGMVTVIGRARSKKFLCGVSHKRWRCRCDCGKVKSFYQCQLRSGRLKSCGCQQYAIKDITGQRYGRLVALNFVSCVNSITRWRCRCDCGKIKVVGVSALHTGDTKSCGCLQKEVNYEACIKGGKVIVHGDARTKETGEASKEYRAWQNLKQRCFNKNHKSYAHYGGRGITVCKRWRGSHSFEKFLADVGRAPGLEFSIDRINVNGNYTPSNVRWSDPVTQMNNQVRHYKQRWAA